MRKAQVGLLTTVLVLLFSLSAVAANFQANASYLLELGAEADHKGSGLLANTVAKIYGDFLADGSFLIFDQKLVGQSEKVLSDRLITLGGLFQVVADYDLQVAAGAGIANFKTEVAGEPTAVSGNGIYGKIYFNFDAHPKFSLLADLGYAPKFKLGEDGGTLLSAQAVANYRLFGDIGIQGTVKYYKVDVGSTSRDTTLVGGGVLVKF